MIKIDRNLSLKPIELMIKIDRNLLSILLVIEIDISLSLIEVDRNLLMLLVYFCYFCK